MFLDFFQKLPPPQRVIPCVSSQRALSARQQAKIAELRANGFRALAKWFAENPAAIG